MANSHIDPPRRRGIVKVEVLENRRRHAATLVQRHLSVEADRRLCVRHSYGHIRWPAPSNMLANCRNLNSTSYPLVASCISQGRLRSVRGIRYRGASLRNRSIGAMDAK